MKLGAEPKKIAILAGLVLAAAVIYFMNSSGGTDIPSARTSAASRPAPPAPAGGTGAPMDNSAARQTRGRTSQEFRPSLKPKRGEDRPDPMSIDPTLKLDLLAKLQKVDVEGTHRSIFDFTQPPAPKPEAAKTANGKPVPSPIVPAKAGEDAKASDAAPSKPAAPPIPLKFYGYVNPSGQAQKRAFFMEGDEIHVVTEGELVKRRYKIVRIGVNSVVVEDTQFGSQQTLPLEEQQG